MPETIIPIFGIMAGIIIPVSVFVWLYYQEKDKNRTILEISKNLDDPEKIEELMAIFGEKKQQDRLRWEEPSGMMEVKNQ